MTLTRKILTFCAILIIFLCGLSGPTLAQTAPTCEQQEEIVAFEMPTYGTKIQGGSVLNIKVAYRITPEALAQEDYPDFVPVRQDIDTFLVNYPKVNEYWEIVNKKLVQFIFDKYPQMSSLRVEMDVMPTQRLPYRRDSIVQSTRPQSCQIATY
ncbi:MAG: hypothetical protein KME26_10070 [Oscillatoria princeps RMCB-10]|jgi:hypothetical protein|nr:hypothetical protein [Oscillatoria princeps RMCB-10]